MYCVATRNWPYHSKYTRHLQNLHSSKVVIQIRIRQHQEKMGDFLQKLHAIGARRQDIMQEIAHHLQPTPALDHSHYKWDSL